jgi:hypothetical protein
MLMLLPLLLLHRCASDCTERMRLCRCARHCRHGAQKMRAEIHGTCPPLCLTALHSTGVPATPTVRPQHARAAMCMWCGCGTPKTPGATLHRKMHPLCCLLGEKSAAR